MWRPSATVALFLAILHRLLGSLLLRSFRHIEEGQDLNPLVVHSPKRVGQGRYFGDLGQVHSGS
jgi:hypothetical protein